MSGLIKKFFSVLTIYRPKTGMIAWLLHRISGLLIIFYLCAHIFVTRILTHSREGFDLFMSFANKPIPKLLELCLLGVVIYHAMNGVRIIIIDFFNGTKHQAKLFWIFSAIAFLLWSYFAFIIIGHIVHS